MTLQESIPLKDFTTFKIGGVARYFIEAHTIKEVREALSFARTKKLEVFVLGGGSNILVADTGFDGLVLHAKIEGIEGARDDAREIITAGAGVSWDALVAYAVGENLAGFECLSGVPGTVGGAVVQNIGAYGESCSDTFLYADVIDRAAANLEVRRIARNACRFSYHDSIFGDEPGRYIILWASFALSRGFSKLPTYRDNRFDVAAFVANHDRQPTLMDVREAILSIRAKKGLLADTNDEASFKGAGSFFHMPLITKEEYEHVQSVARQEDAEKEEKLRPWAWEQSDGSYKIAPGFLLEYTEFKKGYVRGETGISPKHILNIINLGNATAHDIAALAYDMQHAVEEKFAVHLTREVEYVGDVEK
jgi:UDP-N-acetylmuramate dehydrogenase